MIVPYCIIRGLLYVMMFHDARYDEWTFISGGKKLNENFHASAARELYEETRGVIKVTEDMMRSALSYELKVSHSSDTKRGFQLLTTYRVYFVPLNVITETTMRSLEDVFRKTVPQCKEMNENDECRFFRYKDFKHLPRVWDFIQWLVGTEVFTRYIRMIQ